MVSIMKISEKRKAGEILGRGGISQRIITLATDIANGSYKNAIEKAGQIAVLAESATYDTYLDEKKNIGREKEEGKLDDLNKGIVTKDVLLCEC